MKVKAIKFNEIRRNIGDEEGLVVMGAGGDLQEWIVGLSKMLIDSEIVKNALDPTFSSAYVLNTSGGRTDLMLVVNQSNMEIGRLAIWRIQMQDISWISDYLDNYGDQHNDE